MAFVPPKIRTSSANYIQRTVDGVLICGPLLENGASYCAIGHTELCQLSPQILPGRLRELDPIPDELAACRKWQYGIGEHSSLTRDMLGFVILTMKVPDRRSVEIRYLVLDGSSQWVIVDNVTSHGNTNLLDASESVLPAHG